MGAYLSEPVLEKISEKGEKNALCYGASAVQGWRVAMEDAHTCLPEFDEGAAMFGVYDGHGGAEVAEYTAKNMAAVIKSTSSYQKGELKQCLVDAFLQIDKNFTTEEVLADLRLMAGLNKDEEDGDDEDEAALLEKEASMPLAELLAKMKKAVNASGAADILNDSEDEVEANGFHKNGPTEEEKGKVEPADEKESKMDTENGEIVEAESSASVTEEKGAKKEKGETSKEKEEEEGAEEEEESDEEEEASDDEEEEEDEEEDEADEDGEDDEEDEDIQNGLIGAKSDEVAYDSGTTAVVALLKDKQLVVSNVGDSRCVLSRSGIAIDMSVDHKPEDEKEYSRIIDAGGKVTRDGRVNGGLNLSRALGDHSYKLKEDLPPEKQQITALPDVKETILTESDEFMVLACDGIWNVKNSQEVVDFVSQKIRKQRESEELDLRQICEDLFDECMAPDTSGDGTGCDNMTCIIVVFDKNKPIVNHGKSKRKISECLEQDRVEKKQKVHDEK